MHDIVFASNNAGKIKELKAILTNFNIISQNTLQVNAIAETGLSFVENAIIKARNACLQTNLPAIADDSGIMVDALDGKPGIYSARYAGNNTANIVKLLQEMKNKSNRNAIFYTVIVYLKSANDQTPVITEGYWHGKILYQAVGDNGFGYDPIFFIPNYNCSAAQLDSTIKNKISHRAKALKQLAAILCP